MDVCVRGHEWTPENTYMNPDGYRKCRACKTMLRRLTGERTGRPPGRPQGPRPRRVDMSWFTLAELAAVDIDDDSWRDRAACHTENVRAEHTMRWFTGRGHNQKLADAIAVCEQCPVRLECLAYGVQEKFGVWGGVSERARRTLRVQMNNRREEAA